MQNYDIFLVDADNTLLDFHKSSVLAICGAFESLGLECPDEYLQKYGAAIDNAVCFILNCKMKR